MGGGGGGSGRVGLGGVRVDVKRRIEVFEKKIFWGSVFGVGGVQVGGGGGGGGGQGRFERRIEVFVKIQKKKFFFFFGGGGGGGGGGASG